MSIMLETDMPAKPMVARPPLADKVRHQLAMCVYIDPEKGEEIGVMVVPTSRSLRVDRATALGLSPMLGNEIHEAMRFLVEAGEVELTLLGTNVTHMKYKLVP